MYGLVDLSVATEARDPKGRWVAHDVLAEDIKVGDRISLSGKTRVTKVHTMPSGKIGLATQTTGARTGSVQTHEKGSTVRVYRPAESGVRLIHKADLSTPDARRSPEVTEAEFQQYAKRGQAKLAAMQAGSSEPKALTDKLGFAGIKAHAYKVTREPWGGATIDAHTGEEVRPDADAYALTAREPGQDAIHVKPDASEAEFNAAMDKAKSTFAAQLARPGAHLGVFHDADTKSIDIDPTIVTTSLKDVHDIGAYTHAVGGAYHFASGDGYWPPHVKE